MLDHVVALLEARGLEFERIDVENKAALESTLVLAQAVDAKDRYTKDHSKRVSELSVMLAKEIGYDEERLRILEYSGLLHDIGKIGIPEQILNKKGKLTEVEFSTMKKHPETGATIISQSTLLRPLAPIVRGHHENFNGTGYPDGKKGDEIPEESRILRMADYFDAITSKRPYRPPMDPDTAMEILHRERGQAFESQLADTFMEIVEQEGILAVKK